MSPIFETDKTKIRCFNETLVKKNAVTFRTQLSKLDKSYLNNFMFQLFQRRWGNLAKKFWPKILTSSFFTVISTFIS